MYNISGNLYQGVTLACRVLLRYTLRGIWFTCTNRGKDTLMRLRIIHSLFNLLILFLVCACRTSYTPSSFTQPRSGEEPNTATSSNSPSSLPHMHLPPGFQISVYA